MALAAIGQIIMAATGRFQGLCREFCGHGKWGFRVRMVAGDAGSAAAVQACEMSLRGIRGASA